MERDDSQCGERQSANLAFLGQLSEEVVEAAEGKADSCALCLGDCLRHGCSSGAKSVWETL